MRKLIILVLALSTFLGFLYWKFAPDFNQKPVVEGPITLTVWGLFEDDAAMAPLIQAYKKLKPNVTVNYVKQSPLNYRSRVQTQVTSGQGADIFMIHDSWLQMFLKVNALSELPTSVLSNTEYEQIFYPVAKRSFMRENKVYAFPREVDGLALYYNEDILKAAGVTVPVTWSDFVTAAGKVTVTGSDGSIQTAGAALGTTTNVDYWSDIIGLLFLEQPGANLERPDNEKSAEVLKFYTSFITDPRKKVWDVNLDSSTQAFLSGRLAFYFAPSTKIAEIKKINPNLNFKIAPVPQLTSKRVSYANFWGYAVSPTSKNQKAAWEFVKFLTLPDSQRFFYQEKAKVNEGYGLPYSRVDLQSQLADDPIMGAFVNQGPYYDWWYLSSGTQDQGMNDQIIKLYQEAVNATLLGQDPQAALQITARGVQQVLNDFKISPPSASPLR